VKGGFPTVIFFQGKNETAYDGARTKEAIIEWLKKNTLPTFTIVKTVAEVD
jgi:hypothetical protein